MSDTEKIRVYMNHLTLPASNSDICDLLLSAYNPELLQAAEMEVKMLTTGALLASGKFDELFSIVQTLAFSDLAEKDRSYLANSIFSFFAPSMLASQESSSNYAKAMLQLLAAITPEAIFAHKLYSDDRIRPDILKLDYDQKINKHIKGVVFFREFMYGPGSRKHEFGYRIQTALASEGWDVSLFNLEDILSYQPTCKKDFAMVDSTIFTLAKNIAQAHEILSELKQYFSKIIVIEGDPWTGAHDYGILSASDLIDYIWGFTDWNLTETPIYKKRSILFPNVGGFDHLHNIKQASLDWSRCDFNFTGSVQGYNMNRIYWVLESINRNLPIEIKITMPAIDDGLDHESSLAIYAQSLASTHASINFTTRKDGSRMIVGRTTEILSLNRLLIQESCPAFQKYYVNGEHFLEFSTVDELETITAFLRTHPKVAKNICAQGHQFYLKHYSCRKLVEHIQTWL